MQNTESRRFNRNELFAIIFITIFFTSFLWLSASPFYTRGEAREAIVAQHMFEGGSNISNYILPSGYSGVVPSKPPLLHWCIALISSLTGEVNEFSARLPSLLFSGLFLFIFINWLLKDENFYLAPLILLGSFEWYRASISCRVDMLHASSLAAGLIFYYQWFLSKELKFILFFISSLVLAFLSKGPVAVVIPGVIIFIHQLVVDKKELLKNIPRFLLWLLVILFISSIWYFLAYKVAGSDFIQKVVYENFSRFSSTMEDAPHKHTVFYLFVMLLLGFLPWTFFVIYAVKFKKAPFYGYHKKISILLRDKDFLSSKIFFCILSSLVVVLFYSIPSSKRGVYLLAAYPFIAVILSPVIVFFYNNIPKATIIFYKILKIINLILILVAMYVLIINKFETAYLLPVIFLLSALVVFYFYINISSKDAYLIKSFSAVFLLYTIINACIMPYIARSDVEYKIYTDIKSEIAEESTVYTFGREYYASALKLNKNFNSFNANSLKIGDYILLPTKNIPKLSKENFNYELKRSWQANKLSTTPGSSLLLIK